MCNHIFVLFNCANLCRKVSKVLLLLLPDLWLPGESKLEYFPLIFQELVQRAICYQAISLRNLIFTAPSSSESSFSVFLLPDLPRLSMPPNALKCAEAAIPLPLRLTFSRRIRTAGPARCDGQSRTICTRIGKSPARYPSTAPFYSFRPSVVIVSAFDYSGCTSIENETDETIDLVNSRGQIVEYCWKQ